MSLRRRAQGDDLMASQDYPVKDANGNDIVPAQGNTFPPKGFSTSGSYSVAQVGDAYGRVVIDSTGISFGSGAAVPDTFLRRLAAATLAMINGVTGQNFLVYNTYTSDTVYERGFFRWAANVLQIGAETVGGTLRSVRVFGQNIIINTAGTDRVTFGSGGMLTNTDNGYDVGSAAARWRRVYIGSTTVASRPAAASHNGARYTVTDANATTFNSIVAAGGANIVPVFCDGTNWRIG
jgi:hypothetical protein